MALFSISGSGDWEVSDIGNKLCQNFVKDNPPKKKHKTKNKKTQKPNKTDTNTNFLNGKIPLLEKVKRFKKGKVSKNVEDRIPLNNSFFESTNALRKESAKKKGLKRKHNALPDEKKPLLKKAKKQINRLDITTDFASSANKNNVNMANEESRFGKSNNNKKRQKKEKKSEDKPQADHHETSPKAKKIKPATKADLKQFSNNGQTDNKIDPVQLQKRKKQLAKLQNLLLNKEETVSTVTKKNQPVLTLRQKMMRKLKAARFRFLNEQIYSTTGKETQKIFKHDPEAFKAYHEGYKLQVKRWPLNPLDQMIKSLSKMNKTYEVADFGCGEARLAKSINQKVHSFDLVAVNDSVIACDMAHVPLEDSSIDVAVFCLSLMGTNLKDYLLEANRVLKQGGLLKIAEVESRFEDIETFLKGCERYGFKKTWMDLSYNLFYFIDLKKVSSIKDRKKLPQISLQPCLYKKR